jgi:uncharacterized damage-inducible protein DinB
VTIGAPGLGGGRETVEVNVAGYESAGARSRAPVPDGERRVIAFVQTLSDDEWRSACEPEGRTVGQVVEHVAAGHLVIGGIVEAMADGLPLPVAARRTAETGARFNAHQALGFREHSRQQGLRALRRNGRVVERFLETLTDDQLARTIGTVEGPITTEQEIEEGLLGHANPHFDAVRQSVDRPRTRKTA